MTAGVKVSRLVDPYRSPFDPSAFHIGEQVTIDYDEESRTFILSSKDGSTSNFPMPPEGEPLIGIYFEEPGGGDVERNDIFESALPAGGSVKLTYLTSFLWTDYDDAGAGIEEYHGIVGSLTRATDMPRFGQATYSMFYSSGEYKNGTNPVEMNPSAKFSVNFGLATVHTSMVFPSFEFSGSGRISGSGPAFSGTLSGDEGSGQFNGAFYGPSANEVGFGFYYSGEEPGGAEIYAMGTVLGTKNR